MCWTLKCKIDIKHFSVKTKARTRNFFFKLKPYNTSALSVYPNEADDNNTHDDTVLKYRA